MGDEPNPPDILYHYCSNATFLSIIESNTIRLSDLSLSNDSQEGRWIGTVLNEHLKSHNANTDIPMKCFDEIANMPRAFGSCLSEDGDRLSQWRAYADNASGVAIGISTNWLKYCSYPDIPLCNVSFGVPKIIYIDDEHRDILPKLVHDVAHIISNTRHNGKAQRTLDQKAQDIFNILIKNIEINFCIKNYAFHEEAEHRLILQFNNSSDLQNRKINALDYAVSKNMIVPFLATSLHHEGQSPIRKVVLGPRNITPISVVEGFLAKYGHEDVKVIPSKASYR